MSAFTNGLDSTPCGLATAAGSRRSSRFRNLDRSRLWVPRLLPTKITPSPFADRPTEWRATRQKVARAIGAAAGAPRSTGDAGNQFCCQLHKSAMGDHTTMNRGFTMHDITAACPGGSWAGPLAAVDAATQRGAVDLLNAAQPIDETSADSVPPRRFGLRCPGCGVPSTDAPSGGPVSDRVLSRIVGASGPRPC